MNSKESALFRFTALLAVVHFVPAFAAASLPADGSGFAWKQIETKDGLTLSESQVAGSNLLAFKMEAVLNRPITEVASVLLDYEHAHEWIDHLIEQRVLHQIDPLKYIAYTHIGTPIVLKDRDFVTEVSIEFPSTEKAVLIQSRSVDFKGAPVTDFVRGEILKNQYTLTPVGPGQTRVIAESHIDPKGSVPGWITNLFQKSFPRKAFKALEERLATPHERPPADVQNVVSEILPRLLKN